MSARIIFLPFREVGEPPHRFRERFDEWRQSGDRAPQAPPRGFRVEALQTDPAHDPSQRCLPFLDDAGNLKTGIR